jgi:nitroreductase
VSAYAKSIEIPVAEASLIGVKTMSNARTSEYPINEQFLDRWSPRAFSDRPVTEEQVMTMLEAGRWAPSASNLQPWRFFYGLRGEPEFDTLLSLLVPFNESWAKNAGALIFITSVTSFDGSRQNLTHSFDAGSAFMSLSLQAHDMGLTAHGMAGIEYEKVPVVLHLPENLKVEAAVAIGYQGDVSTLPEALRKREVPSQRQPLHDMVFKGHFTGEVKAPA